MATVAGPTALSALVFMSYQPSGREIESVTDCGESGLERGQNRLRKRYRHMRFMNELSLVDAEVTRSRETRRVNMQTDQVGSRTLQVRDPMNVATTRNDNRAGRDTARTGHDHLASAVGQKRGLSGHSLDDENTASRLAVIVDRAALAAPPAENQDLVVRGVMDQVPLIHSLIEVSAAPQCVTVKAQLLEPASNQILGYGPGKRVPAGEQLDQPWPSAGQWPTGLVGPRFGSFRGRESHCPRGWAIRCPGNGSPPFNRITSTGFHATSPPSPTQPPAAANSCARNLRSEE